MTSWNRTLTLQSAISGIEPCTAHLVWRGSDFLTSVKRPIHYTACFERFRTQRSSRTRIPARPCCETSRHQISVLSGLIGWSDQKILAPHAQNTPLRPLERREIFTRFLLGVSWNSFRGFLVQPSCHGANFKLSTGERWITFPLWCVNGQPRIVAAAG